MTKTLRILGLNLLPNKKYRYSPRACRHSYASQIPQKLPGHLKTRWEYKVACESSTDDRN
ncbi:hypothetical protein ACTXT7_001606 [Hymenolepis weldensis]